MRKQAYQLLDLAREMSTKHLRVLQRVYIIGDIHLGKGSSHKLVASQVSDFFPQIDLRTKKANPKDQKVERSINFFKNIQSLDFSRIVRVQGCPHTIHFYGEIRKFKYFLKISRMFNLSDLRGLPSWYLGLSVEKNSDTQLHVYKFE